MTVVLLCPKCGQKSRANPKELLVRCPHCSHPLDPRKDRDDG